LVAGARDLSFDAYAYTVVFIENMCKAVYLASISRVGKIINVSCYHVSSMKQEDRYGHQTQYEH
jgi:solute carrier family 35 protein